VINRGVCLDVVVDGVFIRSRCRALIMPALTEVPDPSGLPMTMIGSPTRALLLLANVRLVAGVDPDDGEIKQPARGDQFRVPL
jgi:hypothetical protein